MKKITTIVIIVLSACTIMSCKADDKPDLKIVEEKIANDIIQSRPFISLPQGWLKNAPKSSGNTWVGTISYADGDFQMERNIAANYYSENKTVTWWFTDNPGDKSEITFGSATSQKTNLSAFSVMNDTGLWTFYNMYVSYNHSDNWGKDQLGDDVLEPGESLKITSELSLNKVTIDFLIIDEDGDTYTIYDKKVKNNGVVKISLDDLD